MEAVYRWSIASYLLTVGGLLIAGRGTNIVPIIAFCSPKGGVGKTTASVITASELAQRGASVTIVDCDPNRGALDWSRLPGVPAGLDVVWDGVTEETITEVLEEVSARSTFVVCDLEGNASLMVAYATGMADLEVAKHVTVAPHVIEEVLNHRSGHKRGVAGIYNLSTYGNEMRRALDLWAAHVGCLVEDKPSNIAPMNSRVSA